MTPSQEAALFLAEVVLLWLLQVGVHLAVGR